MNIVTVELASCPTSQNEAQPTVEKPDWGAPKAWLVICVVFIFIFDLSKQAKQEFSRLEQLQLLLSPSIKNHP